MVMDLRKSRHGSVQMEVQYLYMARCLIEYTIVKNVRSLKIHVSAFLDMHTKRMSL